MKLFVKAGVRYWEDATVGGMEDVTGFLIPFRKGDEWCPTIDLDTGRILAWPAGLTASIHYKVCDAGTYFLEDDEGNLTHRWAGDYVPDKYLCHGGRGHGDYIILDVGPDGKIANWSCPPFDELEWIKL